MHSLSNNDHILKDRRRDLRHRSTDAELLLWQKLRNRQICNFKFFRQFSVGPYILDFYCPEVGLAIELDGSQHSTEQAVAYDKERSEYLAGKDIKVARFWNNEVLTNIEGVVTKVLEVIKPNSL
ncbi:MAG: endonuclease domain-containing protein [Patescibacteria group bacterium]|jgi:very-short-patch-repair endonuclease